ncbi:adenylate/guanylate cyclase domain-containing protein [Rhizobium sp. SSA_523]|uniref:adenylate/guanylate cyclase domain-containing protein n=1 Tax=Rhizobium sp. SSA_523 TaxID=2952477 RepID=UPI002090BC35|nr:adenylate/guanylate cyclase domain-containing protein [Rhizobium sp. SSA_523]MCO5732301.1 adenylate/guanylate cyclase domain-containing protein [Rhizobium sp. SSA_523]WKC21297.1 adenylate/guanylate cyclase domain-containing protein [Rhizobium sp. SSA_523]
MDAEQGPSRTGNVAGFEAIVAWLLRETHGERFIDNIFVDLCDRIRAVGIPVGRATLHFRINHPEWLGARILWKTGLREADIEMFEHGVEETEAFLQSPMNAILQGATEVRQKLLDARPGPSYSLFADLAAQGLTEYVAWPMEHTLNKRHIVTFSSDAEGGFTDQQVATLRSMVPILSLVSEVRIKNALARTLLQTYVGPHAGEQILAGATRRGSGVTLSAIVMIFDVRDFTAISDLWPRDDVIDMLNQCFDALAEPIESHGGEILKFMGDGLLAVFPLANESAPHNAFEAILGIQQAMAGLNAVRLAAGQPELGYGIGVHSGDVMYGNIGSTKRLDFTVIGPTVNIASRLEALTKTTHNPVLLSDAFVQSGNLHDRVTDVGLFPLRGLVEPIEVYRPL